MHKKECFCKFWWATACNEALFQNLPKLLHKIMIFPTLKQFFATLKMIQAKINATYLIFIAFQAIIAYKLNFHPQNPSCFSTVHSGMDMALWFGMSQFRKMGSQNKDPILLNFIKISCIQDMLL